MLLFTKQHYKQHEQSSNSLGKDFAMCVSKKELMPKTYKELYPSIQKNNSLFLEKEQWKQTSYFHKRKSGWLTYLWKTLNFPIIREIWNRTMWYHFTPTDKNWSMIPYLEYTNSFSHAQLVKVLIGTTFYWTLWQNERTQKKYTSFIL